MLGWGRMVAYCSGVGHVVVRSASRLLEVVQGGCRMPRYRCLQYHVCLQVVVELIVIEPRLTALLVLGTRLMGMMFVLNWRTLGVRSGAHLACG